MIIRALTTKESWRMKVFDNLKITVSEGRSTPIYEQLRSQIADYIRMKNIEEGTQLPDIKSMGVLAGVSLRTVERAYTMLINDGICFRRPKKGTFVGHVSAVSSVVEKRRICAIFHPNDPLHFEDDKVLAPLYSGIQSQAQKENVDIWILSEQSLPFYLNCPNLEVVGVLMLYWRNLDIVGRLTSKHKNLRFVFLNYFLDGFENTPDNVSGVFNDDFAGGYEAADYLISKGHSHIKAFTIKLRDNNYQQRIEGFSQALSNNRIADKKNVICCFDNKKEPDEKELLTIGHSLMSQTLQESPKTTAVFCVNDLIASGAVKCLEEHNLRDHIVVVGYDNILPYLSQQGLFSTVAVNFEQIGARALQMLADAKKYVPKVMRIAPRLIPRDYQMLKKH